MRLATAEHYRYCCCCCCCSLCTHTNYSCCAVAGATRVDERGRGQWTGRSVTSFRTTKSHDAAALPITQHQCIKTHSASYISPNSNQINRVNEYIHKKKEIRWPFDLYTWKAKNLKANKNKRKEKNRKGGWTIVMNVVEPRSGAVHASSSSINNCSGSCVLPCGWLKNLLDCRGDAASDRNGQRPRQQTVTLLRTEGGWWPNPSIGGSERPEQDDDGHWIKAIRMEGG